MNNMLCYKDMTFCSSKNCKNKCGRKLTDEIIIAGNKWWTKTGGKDGECPFAVSEFCTEEPTHSHKKERKLKKCKKHDACIYSGQLGCLRNK